MAKPDRKRILILGGGFGGVYTAMTLEKLLKRDPGVEMNCLLFHPGMSVGGGRNYLSSFPGTKEALSLYDVIFLGDVGIGHNELTEKDAELIKGLVEQQASGLVFLPWAWTVLPISAPPISARRSYSRRAVSSGPMTVSSHKNTGPVSSPSSSSMVQTPEVVSPFAIAQWTGAAPRYFGRREPCRLTHPCKGNSSSQRGSIFPYATTTIISGASVSKRE